MNTERAITILLIGIIGGFIKGLTTSLNHTLSNQYFQYKMFRITALVFQKRLNKWILIAFFLIFIFVLILFIGKTLWKVFFSNIIEIRVKDKNKLRALNISIVSIAFLLCVAWGIDHYWIHSAFSYVRALGYTGIIIISIFVIWILTQTRWERTIQKISIGLIILVLSLNAGILIDKKIIVPKAPNVILIGIDTLRTDHMSCYGYNRMTTPHMDQIARSGIVCRKAFSSTSWTLPAFHSILTSLYQMSHGVVTGGYKLNDSFNTLAEVLKNNWYNTTGFISGPFLKAPFGFAQGFDIYEESVSSATSIQSHKDITSPRLEKLILPWLHKHKNEKFFLFIHYWDPHYDYIPPSPYDKIFDPDYKGSLDGTNIETSNKINPRIDKRDLEHIIALYDGEILWTDKHIGKLIETLKDLKIYDDTIIVIVGDHGEEFLEHGGRGHRRTLYNEVIHVPLIFKIPGIQESHIIEEQVSVVDIMPTLLDVLDIRNTNTFDGKTLIPLIYGREKGPVRKIWSELHSNLIALIRGDWKIVYDKRLKKYEFYNLQNDPSEQNNLIEAKQSRGNELIKKAMIRWVTSKRKQKIRATKIRKDKKTKEQLKSLGYIR